MNEIELQGKTIEALKSFNNTIVTSRVYPPEAPQITTAVDRGYKTIKMYLRRHGNLSFSLEDGQPCLSGQPLDQEVLDLFPNLVIYRQLGLLELPKLIIRSGMDRFAFGQLLTVFNASVHKIKDEGGGLEYITTLGLASYFPEETEDQSGSRRKEEVQQELQPKSLLKVRPEVVACLFGKDRRQIVENELNQRLSLTESAVDVLAAGVASTLRDIQRNKKIAASGNFKVMLQKASRRINSDLTPEVARELARLLVEQLKEPALCVLMAQDYPEGFGGALYEELVRALSLENLAGIMVILREQLAKAQRIGGKSSDQVWFLGKTLKKLIESKKGKQVLSTEKARNLIHRGEKERKKRRLENGLQGLLAGDITRLENEELVDYLPSAVQKNLRQTDGSEVVLVVEGMIRYLHQETTRKRATVLKSMAVLGEEFLAARQWSFLDLLLNPLMEEVRSGITGEELLTDIISLLQKVMQKSWSEGANDRGDRILSLFHQVRSGQIALPEVIRTAVATVQDRGIRRAILPKLLEQCLASPNDESLSYRLILQGPVALRFLVESLINTNDATHRLKIIDLLTYSPHFLPVVVHERLQEHMPWYGKRNLIKLLGETGGEEDADALLPYLRHEDFRVQRETFLALYKIGGASRKKLLLQALSYSSDPIRIQIVTALSHFCDAEVASKLVALLADHGSFDEENRNELLLQLLDALSRCPSSVAYKGVASFLETRGRRQSRKIPDPVWAAAATALKFLHSSQQEARKKHIEASQLRKNALKQAAKIRQSGVAQPVITGSQQEQRIRQLLSHGDKGAAGDQLMELIEKTARSRKFGRAEKLREWLVEIAPEDLGRIVQAAEIISREKHGAIPESDIETWGELYDILDTEEFRVLHGNLQKRRYENGELIIRQGALQGSLFLINSGKVKLYFDDSSSEILVNTMEAGQIFGGDSFFEASVWTVSVAAIGTADISILKLDTMRKWVEDYPDLEAKLHEFCKKFDRTESVIRKNSADRRKHRRYRIGGRLQAALLDSGGRHIGTDFGVSLYDISEGGLSCLLQIPEKDNVRLLLGRKLQLHLPQKAADGESMSLVGDILAVRKTISALKEFSLHLKFDTPIDRKYLHDILMIMRETLPG